MTWHCLTCTATPRARPSSHTIRWRRENVPTNCLLDTTRPCSKVGGELDNWTTSVAARQSLCRDTMRRPELTRQFALETNDPQGLSCQLEQLRDEAKGWSNGPGHGD